MKVSNNNSNLLNYKSTNVYLSSNIVNILRSLDVEIVSLILVLII